MIYNKELLDKAKVLIDLLNKKNMTILTCESCTGGLLSGLITSISGSSAVFRTGLVTYANETKSTLLGVNEATLEEFGAVSPETAAEMALGGLKQHEDADITVSITGVAGPTGGTIDKPVGLVYIAVAMRNHEPDVKKYVFDGDREGIRLQSVNRAVAQALVALNQ